MPSFASIAPDKLARLLGTARSPIIIDVRENEFGLASEPLERLVAIVRGADTDRLGLAPEAAGLLAISLGLSRMFADDLEQLEAGMLIYDALYRWSRDATDETHNWSSGGRATK